MCQPLRMLRKIKIKCTILVLTLVVLCVLPTVLVLFSPIYLYRWCVFQCSKICRRNRGKMLSSYSSFFGSDTLFTKPQCTLLIVLLIDGHIEIEELRKKFTSLCLDLRNDRGELVYPELRQYISSWGGFLFWNNDKKFRIENHIVLYEGEQKDVQITTNGQIVDLVNELTNKSYPKTRSPWELLVLRNVKWMDPKSGMSLTSGEQTLILFRGHHSLGDGMALQNLGLKVFEYTPPPPQSSKKLMNLKPLSSRIVDVFAAFWNTLIFPIKAPYEMMKSLIECYDINEWHLPEKEITRVLSGGLSEPVSIDLIKDIKNSWNSSFNGIILAAMAGGIRNYMIKNNVKVPWNMHALTPLPLPGRSAKLRNHVTAACLRLPVGRKTMKERVEAIDEYLDKMKSSTIPRTNYLLFPLAGSLFPWLTKLIFKQVVPTALLSIVPGPIEQVRLIDRPIVDMAFAGGLHPGTISAGFTLLSYNGYLRVLSGLERPIFPTHAHAQELINEIINELYELKKSAECDHINTV